VGIDGVYTSLDMPRAAFFWLFAHGAAVWQASLALLVIAGLALARRRVRRATAAQAGARRASLGEPLRTPGDLREGPVTLTGRIEASGDGAASGLTVMPVAYRATARGSEATWETVAEAHAGHLVLVTAGERIAIVGAVEIVVGSREARLRRPEQAPGPLQRGLAAWPRDLGKLVVQQRSLAAGDEVWAAGALQRESGESAGLYRDRPIRWRLGPAGAPVALAADLSARAARFHRGLLRRDVAVLLAVLEAL
jgi:hypothetical protein